MRLIKAIVLAFALGAAQSAGAQDEPLFPVKSVPMDVGIGFPDGKPIDVAGFYPGQTGADALAVATAFYAAQGATPPREHSVSLEFADTPFLFVLAPGELKAKIYDDIYALFSANASGNQLLALYRAVKYGLDHPNTAATVQAIIGKYGPPSKETEAFGGGRIVEYGYLGGVLKRNVEYPCPSLQQLHRFQPRNGHGPEQMRKLAFRDTENNLNVYQPEDRCDIYLRIELGYGLENGITNPDIVGSMKFSLIDASRFEYANERDVQAQKELRELAAGQRSQGSGAARL